MSLQERAARAVAGTARLLADPEEVARRRRDAGQTWTGGGLADGCAGTVLLYAELSRRYGRYRAPAHAWLAGAVRSAGGGRAPGGPDSIGLYGALPALSYAMHRAALTPADHRGARAHLGRQVALVAGRLADRELRRMADGADCTRMEGYDLVSGLTGLGAHLLELCEVGESGDDALEQVLTALVALTRPLGPLPGWWVAQDVRTYDPTAPERGHANLGLAHGVPGPLALLALAWRQGVRVPGQQQAVRTLADWLLARRREDAAGIWWPESVELPPETRPETLSETPSETPAERPAARPPRASWCYGTPGIASALHLAGTALDVPHWRAAGISALRQALARPDAGPTDAGLCHGRGGLLQVTWRLARESGDPQLAAELPRLAEQLLDRYEEAGPFGFAAPARRGDWADDPAGFLTGAAGAALALHTFATDTAPATRWDRALLLA
ncbi:lanthionine synthetase C family protein [Kitasatospora sp. NPDC088391]|uniref:lanthionine synthetase C family protein n=1 Tax=Kitasatospora sp. NPDC088391 TaxID=3364074 RepID=UPI00381C572E